MKTFFNLRKSKLLLLALLATIVGASPTWAGSGDTNFDEVTISNPTLSYGTIYYGTQLSNDWIVQGGSIYDGGYTGNYFLTASHKRGDSGKAIDASQSGSQTAYLITPAMSGDVSFWFKSTTSSSSSAWQINVYEATENGESFDIGTTDLIPTSIKHSGKGSQTWTQVTISNVEGKHLAFKFFRVAIDDFEGDLFVEGSCKSPKNLAKSDITTNSANLSWTAGEEGQDTWQVVYSTDANFDKDAASKTNVSTTSYQLTGLSDNTKYYVAVRSYCSENEQSAWVATSFKTPMAPISSFPWTEDFNNLTTANTIPDGWDNSDGTTTNNAYKWCYNTSTSGNGATNGTGHEGKCIRFDSYNNSSNNTNFLKTPVMNFPSGAAMQLKFWYKNPKGGDFSVYISNDSGATYTTELATGLTGATAWTEKVIDIPTEFVNNVVIVFKGTSNYGSGDGYIYLDDVTVKENAAYAWSISGSDVVNNTIAFGTVKNNSTTKTFTITNDGASTLTGVTVTSSDNTVFTVSDTNFDIEAGATKDITVTFVKGVVGEYSETITVSQANVDNIVLTATATYETPSVAQMAIKIGEDAVGETVAFGNVGKAVTKTFTVENAGEADLTITSIASNNTTDFTVSPATLTVQGGQSGTFTVTFVWDGEAMNVEKTANITVTPSNEGLSPVTFAVTGTRIEQWSEDFSGSSLPEGWEITNGTYWKFEDNMLKGSYSYGNFDLITPSLTVEEGQSMTFDYRMTGTYRSLDIQYSKYNGAWTSYGTISYSGLTQNQWYTYTIENLAAGNYKFRFGDSQYDLDNFQGFKRNMNDPKLGIYTDAECTVAAATSVTKDFGFVTEDATQTYYIKNDGTGTLTLDQDEVPAGFSAVLGKTELAKDESTTLTITFGQISGGYRGGNIVVNGSDGSSFTVAVSGVMVDNSKLNLDFATDNIPTTWANSDFTKNSTDISTGYNGGTLQTATLTATANEQVVVRAYQEYTSSSYTFGVNYRLVGEESWNTLIAPQNIGTNYVTLVGTIAEAGNYELQFTGKYVHISNIYGLTEPQEPVMAVYDGESLAGTSYNFDNVSDEADATWTLTVKNEGKATLTGLTAALSGDNAAHYSVEVSATELAINATATVTVKQLKENLGNHNAILTISATSLSDKVITLSGFTYDHNKLFVDFENNAFPTGWTVGTSWTVTTPYSSTAHHAQQGNYNVASALITTPLSVGENDKLTFDAARLYSSSAPELKVRYTTNGGITWSEYIDYASQVTSGDYVKLELTGVPAGTAMVEFYGRYIKIDNIYGFVPTTAPVMALTENNVAVVNGSTKEFGTLTAAATATYVLSNTGNGDLVSTLSSNVVTFEVTSMGEGVTLSENTLTIPAGKSATIVVTMPYVAPYETKNGSLTITSTGWVAPVTLNYTASLNDPTALYEDFTVEAKPAGWYQEASGWLFTTGTAHVYTGVDKEIITEKYGAEAGKNVLSFDAKLQSTYADGELKVYTSTDRQNWTLAKTVTMTADVQNVTLDALADGEYYVKFVSLNASIDNLAGLKKLTAPEHDLYVSSTTFPTATLIPETVNGVSASATVYSLRADETGVVAKLFFDEEELATATHSVSLDGSYTFSLNCNVPATEKTYAAKIVVYYSDNTVAWESQTTNVVVSQTRTLQITDFALTSDDTVDADANNQFTSTFNVTVKNNGTVAQDAANVSVSITDAEGNVLNGNATSWTLANSQTVFVNPGAYTTDDAVLALWCWNTDVDGVFIRLTKINDELYSAERNGKTNFCIVRLKKEGDDGYSSENGGLNWTNYYNQSTNMTNTDGNFFSFKDWNDKDGEEHQWFEFGTMTNLPVGASTTMAVSVTTSALEGGVITFKVKENLSNTVSSASANVTVNAAAPKFELALGSTPIEDGDAVAYGIVKEATTKTFTISNTGTKLMEAPTLTVPEGFEANYVAADGAESDWMLFFYKDGTVDADQGNFKAYDTNFIIENVNVPAEGVNFAVHKKNGNDWTDIYGYSDEGGHLNTLGRATKLATATNASGWMTIAAGTYDFIWNANDQTITAKPAGAILAGETKDVNVTLKAEQGKKIGDLVFTYKVDASTEKTFNVALSGRSISADTWSENFEGTAPLATWFNENGWTVYESDGNNVARLSGWDAKAVITPRLEAAENEILTFDVLSAGNFLSYAYSTDGQTWSDEVVITTTGEQTFTASEAGNYYLRFTGRNAYIDNLVGFKLNPLSIKFDETDGTNVEAGYYATVTLKHSFVAGWNTVCLPFTVNVTDIDAAAVAYSYDDYNASTNELTFNKATKLTAGQPYVIYVPQAINEDFTFSTVAIAEENANAGKSEHTMTFQGTYEPKAAGSLTGCYGLTAAGKIAKASASATMNGFRGYFQNVPADARVVFMGGDATGIRTISVDTVVPEGTYNLQGQKVEQLKKSGLYIINGKKTVVK